MSGRRRLIPPRPLRPPALLALVLTVTLSGCDAARKVYGRAQECLTIRAAVSRAIHSPRVTVRFAKETALLVSVANTPMGARDDIEKSRFARDIARIAYRACPEPDEIDTIMVAYAIQHDLLPGVTINGEKTFYSFETDELEPAPTEAASLRAVRVRPSAYEKIDSHTVIRATVEYELKGRDPIEPGDYKILALFQSKTATVFDIGPDTDDPVLTSTKGTLEISKPIAKELADEKMLHPVTLIFTLLKREPGTGDWTPVTVADPVLYLSD
jgi:hypothetical protein